MKLTYYISFFWISFLISTSLSAQTIETDEDGELIVVYENGNWKYYDDENPEHIALSNILNRRPQTPSQKKAVVLAEKLKKQAAEAQKIADNTSVQRILAEDALKVAKKDKVLEEKELLVMEGKLNLAKKMEKEAKKLSQQANKLLKKAEEIVVLPERKRTEALVVFEEELSKDNIVDILATDIPLTNNRSAVLLDGEIPDYVKYYYEKDKKYQEYSKKEDVILNPPEKNCSVVFDGVEEFSGKNRKDIAKKVLFTHTNERLRQYLGDKEYITCEGFISSKSGYVYLVLEITIANARAHQEFGKLEKGSLLSFRMIDDSSISFVNMRSDEGKVDEVKETVTYQARYAITSANLKILKNKEVSLARIVWATGYEDYEIFNIDFVINQFKCL